jgi:hypothetical protein
MALSSNLNDVNRTKVRPYKMFRAQGSVRFCESSIGTRHIVATDFNPLDNE